MNKIRQTFSDIVNALRTVGVVAENEKITPTQIASIIQNSVVYPTPTPTDRMSISICCVGDSITAGSNGPTYRQYLPSLLE